MRLWRIAILTSVVAGCASSNVLVKVPSRPAQDPQFRVVVNDLRAPGVSASTRTAAFGAPMGNVTFDPPERQLVKDALEVALASRGRPQPAPGSYTCDILEFGVNTNTTALYWDVIGVIRLRLKRDGKQQELLGTHTERTYVWPGEDIIRKVVEESLKKTVAGLEI